MLSETNNINDGMSSGGLLLPGCNTQNALHTELVERYDSEVPMHLRKHLCPNAEGPEMTACSFPLPLRNSCYCSGAAWVLAAQLMQIGEPQRH
jgi:hypothetical protein